MVPICYGEDADVMVAFRSQQLTRKLFEWISESWPQFSEDEDLSL